MKPEILSPVGNMEMLYQAIHNGADAVYLAGHNYGARKYAQNFTNFELEEAVNYAHLYNVKVYVTVNTMIYEREVQGLIKYIEYLSKINVDAIIISDIGMIDLISNMFPNLEMHASTQCHIHNNMTIKYFENLGIKRVVLSRETTKEEIKTYDTKVEKEIFIHGALCICYSGCCLFSSLNGFRSGNRGMCTAPCRLPYELYKNNKKIITKGKYLLSTKDLNLSCNIKDVLEINPSCLKIEGRMKSPEYVGYITRIYRRIVDNYYQNKSTIVSDEEINNMKKLFNRSFTTGHFLNDNILNPYLPNNHGVELGKVIKINPKIITIKLTENINNQDGIKFYPSDKGMIINKMLNNKNEIILSALKGDIIKLYNTVNLETTDKVLKTTDKHLINELKIYSQKKIPIDIKIIAKLNQKLYIEYKVGKIIKHEEGIVVTQSKTISITKDDIIKSVTKLGNTPYQINNINIIADDNIFIPVSNINKIRQSLIKKITEERLSGKTITQKNYSLIKGKNKEKIITISVYIRNEEMLKECLKLKIDNIYTDDYNLYKKYKMITNIYYNVSRTTCTYKEFINEKLLISDFGGIYKYSSNNNIITDYTLNIANNYAVSLLEKQNVKKVNLSLELSSEDITKIDESYNTEVFIYGTPELMVIKSNILNIDKDKYYLKAKDKFYPVKLRDGDTHIYHHKKINNIHLLKNLKEKGINNFRIDFFDETNEKINSIINKIRKELE